MLGHANPRELLVARLAIANRRKALLRQLDEVDAEARPYDEVVMGWLAEGRDVHLEHLDRAAGRWSRYTVRRDGWGRAEFVPADSVSSLRFPDAPPIGADAATDAGGDADGDDDMREAAAHFDPDAIREAAFRGAVEAEFGPGGMDEIRALVGAGGRS